MFDIPTELKKLPDKPGVYIMKDDADQIIYVGKAKVLKNRVRQYFQNSANHSTKVRKMVANIDHFEYIVTSSEVEALILENNLIKKHNPKYNILLKDDKTYPYIKVSVNEKFPRIFMTRNHQKDKAKYFGPFTSGLAVKENIELIHKIWPLRRCYKKFPRDFNKERPCLNYHIGKCKAPCNNKISEEDYNTMIEGAINLLNGKVEGIIKDLTAQMMEKSDDLDFERAAEIRDTINSVKRLKEKQVIENLSTEDRDVIGFAKGEEDTVMQVFFIRGGKMTGRESFILRDTADTDEKELISDFIKQFYSGTPFIPKEIILPCDIEDFEIISEWLSNVKGQRVILLIPQKGERHKLVDLATQNAVINLEQFGEQMKREQQRTIGALKQLQEAMGLEFELNRIESYDISNIQGFESVGSMVVFEQGKPKRSDYRKFKIKSVIGPNDFASMEEVITRRFLRYKNAQQENADTKSAGFEKLPDMIFLDGGKGQISAVKRALDNLDLQVRVCGMVKDDRHRTRGLLYNDNEIFIPYTSEGFKLITRIQDEVHRFAIEYHRKLRDKKQVRSILDDIEGIGATRRKALLKHFGDVEAIKNADIEALRNVEGMEIRSATNVYNFFHNS